MRIHYKLCDAADVTIAVTEQMQRDMIECRHMIEADEFLGKDCKSCSWKDVEFNDIGFCEIEAIQKMVLGGSRIESIERKGGDAGGNG